MGLEHVEVISDLWAAKFSPRTLKPSTSGLRRAPTADALVWVAAKELNLSYHTMDIPQIMGFLDYCNFN